MARRVIPMSCDLEAMVLTSRLNSCARKSSRRPAGAGSQMQGAQLGDVAFKAHQFLVDGQAVGHDRRFLHKARFVHLAAGKKLFHVGAQALAVGDERSAARAAAMAALDPFQGVRAGVKVFVQGLALDGAHGGDLVQRPFERFQKQGAQGLAVFLGLDHLHDLRQGQHAHHRAVVPQAGQARPWRAGRRG